MKKQISTRTPIRVGLFGSLAASIPGAHAVEMSSEAGLFPVSAPGFTMARCAQSLMQLSQASVIALSLAATAAIADEPPAAYPDTRFEVITSNLSEWVEYDGVVDSRNRIDVIPLVTGRVKSVHVRAGQRVKHGDILLELESEDFLARRRVAQSRLNTARANLERMEREHQRIQRLHEDKLASAHDLGAATANWKSALAEFDGAEAAVKDAATQLGYTTLTSPIDGIVADKSVNPGDFATPGLASGRDVTEGPVLVTLYDPDSMWIETRIPERFAREVEPGRPARVTIGAAGLAIEAEFAEVVPVVDQATRSFIARIDLPSANGLKLGMLGRVHFASGSRSTIIVPSSALLKRGQLDVVFIDNLGSAELRLVRTGRQERDGIEVLSGLTAGERIVLNPTESLRDGDRL